MNIRYIYLFLVMTLLLSCRSTKTNHENQSSIRTEKINTMQFVANINPRFPDFSQPFSAKIRIANYDSVSMTAIGPFGVTVGRLYADANFFLFHNIFENTIYQGKSNSENLSKSANLNLSFVDLISLLRGEPPGNFNEFKLFNKQDKQLIYVRSQKGQFAEFAVLSADDYTLLQYQRKDSNDLVELNVFFSDFKKTESIDIAHKITLDFPIINGNMVIDLNNIEINKQLSGEFRFNMPNSAKIINLD